MKSKILGLVLGLAVLVPSIASASVSLTLTGGSVSVRQGSAFTDPGYSANSTVDGDITGSVITSPVDTGVVGDTTRFYNVTDSALDSASASRDITVTSGGGGSMINCSNPMAPGWNVNYPDGGCGGNQLFYRYGSYYVFNGINARCEFFFGCMIPKTQAH